MNYSEIYTALKDQGFTWQIAADAIDCSASHVMNVAARRGESKSVAKKLSALIGKDVSDVFPDIPRYQENNEVKRQSKLMDAKARLENAGLVSSAKIHRR